ncbi:UDP-N-acetylmuramate--L-alanine ligase [Streptomyces sp. NPDC048172]|uniref:UDP-N-acetylmuramate--L-alanine ligase n=1 Tax=Streptomyces sp. NPDC048172 TaxID=3365505 RepID=UPI00371D74AE
MTETAVPTVVPSPVGEGVDLSRVHFVGIGGSGMLPLARVCAARGLTVSGSDVRPEAAGEELAALGVRVLSGQQAWHVPGDATAVVFTHAVGADNPEIREAQRRGIPLVHRSMALDAVMEGRTAIGVTGTHGKTSTTGMLASALSHEGCAPSYVLGGRFADGDLGGRHGAGKLFVAEVDESDRTLVNTRVDIAVIPSVGFDHPENYRDLAAHLDAYEEFAGRMRPGGTVVLHVGSDVGSDGGRELAERLRRDGVQLVAVGGGPEVDWRVEGARTDARGSRGVLHGPDGATYPLELRVLGAHQVHNAACAVAAAHAAGVDPGIVARKLVSSAGVRRRLSPVPGVAWAYDSFAHHPVEVAADLAAAREVAAGGRVLVVFQPAGRARLNAFGPELGRALAAADEVVLTGAPDGAARLGHTGVVEEDRAAAVAYVAQAARPGDVVLLMGTGDLVDHGHLLADATARSAELVGAAA